MLAAGCGSLSTLSDSVATVRGKWEREEGKEEEGKERRGKVGMEEGQGRGGEEEGE